MAQQAAQFLGRLARYSVGIGLAGSALQASLYNVDGGERAVMFDRFTVSEITRRGGRGGGPICPGVEGEHHAWGCCRAPRPAAAPGVLSLRPWHSLPPLPHPKAHAAGPVTAHGGAHRCGPTFLPCRVSPSGRRARAPTSWCRGCRRHTSSTSAPAPGPSAPSRVRVLGAALSPRLLACAAPWRLPRAVGRCRCLCRPVAQSRAEDPSRAAPGALQSLWPLLYLAPFCRAAHTGGWCPSLPPSGRVPVVGSSSVPTASPAALRPMLARC